MIEVRIATPRTRKVHLIEDFVKPDFPAGKVKFGKCISSVPIFVSIYLDQREMILTESLGETD